MRTEVVRCHPTARVEREGSTPAHVGAGRRGLPTGRRRPEQRVLAERRDPADEDVVVALGRGAVGVARRRVVAGQGVPRHRDHPAGVRGEIGRMVPALSSEVGGVQQLRTSQRPRIQAADIGIDVTVVGRVVGAAGGGEVRRVRAPDQRDHAVRVDPDRPDDVSLLTTEERGVEELRGTGLAGVELADKRVGPTAVRHPVGVGDGEHVRIRDSRTVTTPPSRLSARTPSRPLPPRNVE